MKLRKGFLAAATAAAMMTAGVVAPANAQADAPNQTVTATGNGQTDPTPPNPEKDDESTTPEEDNDMSSEFKELDAKDKAETIKAYLSIITAVIGVLSAAFGFAAKYLPMFK